MALVTRDQLENSALDLEHVAEIILGVTASGTPITESTDRLGNIKLTISELLRRLGRENPVPYASGVTITRSTQTVSYDAGVGNQQWTWIGLLPHTTTGLAGDLPGTNVNWITVFPLGLGGASLADTGTGANELPRNSDLGSASLADTGTSNDQVPLNSDLGDSSVRDVGNSAANVAPGSGSTTYAPLSSPLFTGDPQAPTPSPVNSSTSIATTEYVQTAVGTRIVAALVLNGTGVITPLSSDNVDTVDDNGVGLYTINLTTAIPAIYGFFGSVGKASAGAVPRMIVHDEDTMTRSTTQFQFAVEQCDAGTRRDEAYICIYLVA